MIYLLITKYLMQDYHFPGFNLFRYITFRAAIGAFIALLIGILLGPKVIERLRQLKIGQYIRKTDPNKGPDLSQMHSGKSGTPTMGGILILISFLIPVLLLTDLTNRLVILTIIVTVWLGGVGFVDDYIKLAMRRSEGLTAANKFAGQLVLGALVGIYLYYYPILPHNSTEVFFPFFKRLHPNLGWLYIPFVMLVIVGTSNAVNLTDGLDGLAIGCVSTSALAYLVMTYIVGRVDYTTYLNIPYVPGSGELTIIVAALVGASLGFLWFNSHPAQVFMGDTGSLALGGVLGVIALLIKQEMSLAIVGGIFVAEAFSVIIQVTSFKLRGKRVFLMSPLHHHFERTGLHESKIIIRFWIVSAILAMLGLATLKIR
jgi:phospho-N-acetylmuramoyl-pentapeptide-transferase